MLGVSSGTSKSQLHRATTDIEGGCSTPSSRKPAAARATTMGRRQPQMATDYDARHRVAHGSRPGPPADDPLAADDAVAGRHSGQLTGTSRPAADLWTGIAARLSTPPSAKRRSVTLHAAAAGHRRHAAHRRFRQRVVAGAAAASRRRSPRRRHGDSAPWSSPRRAVRTDVQRATFADAQYDAAVADLERILREQSRAARSADRHGDRAQPAGHRRRHQRVAGGARCRPGQHLPELPPGRRAAAEAGPAAPGRRAVERWSIERTIHESDARETDRMEDTGRCEQHAVADVRDGAAGRPDAGSRGRRRTATPTGARPGADPSHARAGRRSPTHQPGTAGHQGHPAGADEQCRRGRRQVLGPRRGEGRSHAQRSRID